jgi:hypothetical protein
MSKRFGLRGYAGLTGVVALAATVTALMAVGASGGVTHAGFTTTDTTFDPPGNCQNGNEAVNCNIYSGKQYVWMNGGPATAGLAPGNYFFAVLVPSGQGGNQSPNDGTENNLSDTTLSPETSGSPSGDLYTNRTFTVNGDGSIGYSGDHTFDAANDKIRLMPYDDTTNNGGVYILAICSLANADPTVANQPGVDPSDCKYDAFKVNTGEPCTLNCDGNVGNDLTAAKSADGAFTRSFAWNIAKNVDNTSITQYNGSPTATFHYTVTVNPSGHSDGSYGVTGDITVSNTNPLGDDVIGVSVTDAINSEPNATCNVSDGSADSGVTYTVDPTNATIPGGGAVGFPYSCAYAPGYAPANTNQTNTATVAWSMQFLSDGSVLVGNSATGTAPIDWAAVTPSLTDDCINVTDTLYGGTLSSAVCVDAGGQLLSTGLLGSNVTGTLNPAGGPYTSLDLKYSHTVATPSLGACATVNNTATSTTDTTGTTRTASQSVGVCNYLALTIGYWGNHLASSTKNTTYYDSNCTKVPNGTGCSNNGPWAKKYLPQYLGPYAVDTILKAANVFAANNCSNASSSSQNAVACLAAQLLGAELNVATGLSNSCIVTVPDGITDANSWLSGGIVDTVAGITYAGPTGTTYNLTSAKRNEALKLKNKLVNFNQGGGC